VRLYRVEFLHSLGQNENPPRLGLCQLTPATDIPPDKAMCKECQRRHRKTDVGQVYEHVFPNRPLRSEDEPRSYSGVDDFVAQLTAGNFKKSVTGTMAGDQVIGIDLFQGRDDLSAVIVP